MDTPVEKRPLDATAREPPRSTAVWEMLTVGGKGGIGWVRVTHAGYGAAVENTKTVLERDA